jgi:hypothetical protein
MGNITKSLWRLITGATAITTPGATDILPVATQPGTPLVTQIRGISFSDLADAILNAPTLDAAFNTLLAKRASIGDQAAIASNEMLSVNQSFTTDVGEQKGIRVFMLQTAGNNTGILRGAEIIVANTGPGTVDQMHGLHVEPINNGGGTVNSVACMFLDYANAGGATTTNLYGLLVTDLHAKAVGVVFNIFSQGAASKNKFEGDIDGGSFTSGGTPGFDGTVSPVTSITVKKGIVTAVS